MVVHLREPEVGEGQVAELVRGVAGCDITLRHPLEQVPEARPVGGGSHHGTRHYPGCGRSAFSG